MNWEAPPDGAARLLSPKLGDCVLIDARVTHRGAHRDGEGGVGGVEEVIRPRLLVQLGVGGGEHRVSNEAPLRAVDDFEVKRCRSAISITHTHTPTQPTQPNPTQPPTPSATTKPASSRV